MVNGLDCTDDGLVMRPTEPNQPFPPNGLDHNFPNCQFCQSVKMYPTVLYTGHTRCLSSFPMMMMVEMRRALKDFH